METLQKYLLIIFISSGYAFMPLSASSLAFWPPDMIPHPHIPGDDPSGPGEPQEAAC